MSSATSTVHDNVSFNFGGITPPLLMGVMWAGIAIAVTFTAIRTAIRLHASGRLFLDDYFVYFALTLLLIMGILYSIINNFLFELEAISKGLLQPSTNFVSQADFFLRAQFAIIVMFWTTLWAVKFSFLFHYKKLFKGLPTLTKWWYAVSVFSLLAYLGCWATQLASCEPLPTYFKIGQCETSRDIFVGNLSLYYATSVDIICDFMIMALPIRLIWDLQVNSRQKKALFGIFSLGAIIVIFAIVRVVETRASSKHVDPIWLGLWSMLEASIAVTVSCLPSFRVLLSSRADSAVRNYKSRSASLFSRRRKSANLSTSNSRFSVTSRSHKGAIRLEPINTQAAQNKNIICIQETELPTCSTSRTETESRQMGHTTTAEGLEKRGTRREWGSGGSQEEILPKVPEYGVHVQHDIYMTSEAV